MQGRHRLRQVAGNVPWIRVTKREPWQVPRALILGFRLRSPLYPLPWLGVVILEPRQVLHALILSLVRMHRSPQCKHQGPCRCLVSSLRQFLPRL